MILRESEGERGSKRERERCDKNDDLLNRVSKRARERERCAESDDLHNRVSKREKERERCDREQGLT